MGDEDKYPGTPPDWINQSIYYIWHNPALQPLFKGVTDSAGEWKPSVVDRLQFFGQWTDTCRYITGEYTAEAADLLLLPSVRDLAFELVQQALENGSLNPETDLDRKNREHFKNFNKAS